MTDGVGDGGADADGREVHDDVGEAEHDLREGFGEAEHGLAEFFGNLQERDAEKDGEGGDLQDLVFGHGFGDVFGEDVQEEVVPAESSDGLRGGFGGRGGESDANSGASEVNYGYANEECDGGDDFEVQETLPADAADFAHAAVTRDAGDERAENEWRYDHFDEAEKNVAEDAKVRGELRRVEAEFEADEHGEEDPKRERAFLQAGVTEQEECSPAESDDPRMGMKKRRQQEAKRQQK